MNYNEIAGLIQMKRHCAAADRYFIFFNHVFNNKNTKITSI